MQTGDQPEDEHRHGSESSKGRQSGRAPEDLKDAGRQSAKDRGAQDDADHNLHRDQGHNSLHPGQASQYCRNSDNDERLKQKD